MSWNEEDFTLHWTLKEGKKKSLSPDDHVSLNA